MGNPEKVQWDSLFKEYQNFHERRADIEGALCGIDYALGMLEIYQIRAVLERDKKIDPPKTYEAGTGIHIQVPQPE